MRQLILLINLVLISVVTTVGQKIIRIDGSVISGDALQNKIEQLMKVANVSGVGISIFNENIPVFSKTFGMANVQKKEPLTPKSVMYACSFAKNVFAYIVMQLVDEGKLDLDKPLVSYLDKPLADIKINGYKRGYQDLKNDTRLNKITGRMCLTHSTGLPNWRWIEKDKKLKIKFEPGSRYSYSGEGFFLLQYIVEQITGEGLEALSQERVFKPLGMKNTSQVWQSRFEPAVCYGHNTKGEPYELMKWNEASAGGSMSTTLEDYTKFFGAMIQGKGLSKAAFKQMTSTQIRIKSKQQFGSGSWVDDTDNDKIELSYGLGVGVFKTPYGSAFFKEGHDDGWGHYSICFPDKKTAIVIMTNNDNGERIFKELLAYTIGDIFTPWKWENYIPYDFKN